MANEAEDFQTPKTDSSDIPAHLSRGKALGRVVGYVQGQAGQASPGKPLVYNPRRRYLVIPPGVPSVVVAMNQRGVGMAAPTAAPIVQAARVRIEDSQSRLESRVATLGGKVRGRFKQLVNAVVVENLTDAHVKALRAQGYSVHLSQVFTPVLQKTVPLIGANRVQRDYGIRGDGIKIGILDTGVDYTHPAFGSCASIQSCRKVRAASMVPSEPDFMDLNGHGTHVAAIAAGEDPKYPGVAPGAIIYSYKVMAAAGYGYTEWIIAGLEQALRDGVNVVNMSLGSGTYYEYTPDNPLSNAVNALVDAGVSVAVAAGNSGYYFDIGSPADASKAVTVAASNNEDKITSFSTRGPNFWVVNRALISAMKPDVTAPGSEVCAARASGAYGEYLCGSGGKHVSLSGTSMAAPHVAGVLALLRQKYPTWTPAQLKQVLKNTAKSVVPDLFAQGAGRVDALKAIAWGAQPPAVLQVEPVQYALNEPILTYNIKGSVTGSDVRRLKVSYAKFVYMTSSERLKWMPLPDLELPRYSGSHVFNYSLDGRRLPEGELYLRFEATDSLARTTFVYANVFVDNFAVKFPLAGDVLRLGSAHLIQTRGEGEVSFRVGKGNNPTSWSNLSSNHWDTRSLSEGIYTIEVTYAHEGLMDKEKTRVRLTPYLQTAHPIRIPYERCSGVFCNDSTGQMKPYSVDVDGDGTQEIVIHRFGWPARILVFKQDGSLFWNIPIGESAYFGYNETRASTRTFAVGQGVGGVPTLFVLAKYGSEDLPHIYAFRAQPRNRSAWEHAPGFPLRIAGGTLDETKLSTPDLNADGISEIVLIQAEPWNRDRPLEMVKVLSASGIELSRFQIPRSRLDMGVKPIFKNFDSQPDLEMAVGVNVFDHEGSGGIDTFAAQLHIFKPLTGVELSGWPKTVRGVISSSPTAADLDGDGKSEVLFMSGCSVQQYYNERKKMPSDCGGFYAFSSGGATIPGWPKYMKKYAYENLAVADIDGDGKDEVFQCIGLNNVTCEAYNGKGQRLQGWPQLVPIVNGDNEGPVVAKSMNGSEDFQLIHVSGGFFPAQDFKKVFSYEGGLHVYSAAGDVKSPVLPIPMSNSYSTPIVVQTPDGVKRVVATSPWESYRMEEGWDLGKPYTSIYIFSY